MPLCSYCFLPRHMLYWVSSAVHSLTPDLFRQPISRQPQSEVLESGFHVGTCSQHISPQRGALPGEATWERCDPQNQLVRQNAGYVGTWAKYGQNKPWLLLECQYIPHLIRTHFPNKSLLLIRLSQPLGGLTVSSSGQPARLGTQETLSGACPGSSGHRQLHG